MEWYTAIRSAKLNRLAIAYPGTTVEEVGARLSLSIICAFKQIANQLNHELGILVYCRDEIRFVYEISNLCDCHLNHFE